MSEAKYFRAELAEALFGNDSKMVTVPENVLENMGKPVLMEPFKDELYTYQCTLMDTMMDIISEEIKKLTPAQQEIIHHYFFLGKRIKHISHELNLRIPTLVERKDGALKKLKLRLSKHPIFTDLYKKYCGEDFPTEWLK